MNQWLDKYVFAQERLRGETIHKLLGDRLFDKEIWHISKRSISGGLSLGLFIAFTPTIPFQMLISAICAIWLRVNLPIALAACWITNPLTMIYVYVVEFRIGRFFFNHLPGFYAVRKLEPAGAVRQVFINAVYVWTGGMIIGCIAALAGYILIRIFWRSRGSRDEAFEVEDAEDMPQDMEKFGDPETAGTLHLDCRQGGSDAQSPKNPHR